MQDREVNIENTAALPWFDGDLRVAFIGLESRSENDVRHEMAQKKERNDEFETSQLL
jgi:hypothetical protein